jgi:uncharacterized protein with PIN domain
MSEAPTIATVRQDYETEDLTKQMDKRLNKYFSNGSFVLDADDDGRVYLERRGDEIYRVVEDEDAIPFDEGPIEPEDAMFMIYSRWAPRTATPINAKCAQCGKSLLQFECPHKKEFSLRGVTITQWVYRCSRCGYMEVF